MNKVSAILAVVLMSSTVFAGVLDGIVYCRTEKSGQAFGRPAGVFRHCVSFKDDKMKDNISQRAGKSPIIMNYAIVDGKIVNDDTGAETGYEVHTGGAILVQKDGKVLKAINL